MTTYHDILTALAPEGFYDKDMPSIEGGNVPMMLAQTGGGCATIYIGEPYTAPDGNRTYDAYPVVIGPGSYHWSNPNASTFTFDELFVGPDDMGETAGDEVHTMQELVRSVVDWYQDHTAKVAR